MRFLPCLLIAALSVGPSAARAALISESLSYRNDTEFASAQNTELPGNNPGPVYRVRRYDGTTGNLKGSVVEADSRIGRISQIAYSPNGDRVAAACNDGTVRVYDPDKLNVVRDTIRRGGRVYSVAYSPDGKLASGASDGTVQIDKGNAWLAHRGHAVTSVLFLDANTVVSASDSDPDVIIHDLRGNKEDTISVKGGATALDFAADLKKLAVGASDGVMALYRLERDQQGNWHVIVAVDSPIATTIGPGNVHLSFEPPPKGQGETASDGPAKKRRLATATSGPRGKGPYKVRLFFVDTLQKDRDMQEYSKEGGIRAVAFKPDGSRVASGEDDPPIDDVEDPERYPPATQP
jgi:WD40 repeat protein